MIVILCLSHREAVRRRAPEVSKLTIPEDDPIRIFLPKLEPLDKDQVGEYLGTEIFRTKNDFENVILVA